MKKIIIISFLGIVIVCVALIAAVVLLPAHKSNAPTRYTYKETPLTIGSTTITALISDTETLRTQGLSDRESLPQNEGMLFIFDSSGRYGFWMKDMHFPLDFVWIDEHKKIVAVTIDVPANSYPAIYTPPMAVRYVLEVNAGFAAAHNIQKGDTIEF